MKKSNTHSDASIVSRTSPGGITLELISIICMIIIFIPILWMACVSLKIDESSIPTALHYFAPPFTLSNYVSLLTGNTRVVQWLFNSVGIAAIVTIASSLLCALASFALAKLNFRYKKFMYIFFLVGLMVPTEATIVSLFVLSNNLGILDSYIGLILPALANSINVIIMTSFMSGIPNELIEASRIDGANEFTTFLKIILPSSRTVIVTVSIFTFIGNWNSYLWPYLCAMSEDMFTLPVGIPTFISQFSIDKTIPMTVNMIASIPILVFFVIFERQIVKGITLTGIKG